MKHKVNYRTNDMTANKEKPIIFSADMVLAILDGRKTQTRRVVKPQPDIYENGDIHFKWATFYLNGLTYTWDSNGVGGENWQANDHPDEDKFAEALRRCPANRFVPYRVGQHLWVREVWCGYKPTMRGYFKADMSYWDHAKNHPVGCVGEPDKAKYGSPIHMPRWASRITLEVTEVRVQRVQSISEEDAISEGCIVLPSVSATANYRLLWNKINGKKHPWNSNPWVWAISFQRR